MDPPGQGSDLCPWHIGCDSFHSKKRVQLMDLFFGGEEEWVFDIFGYLY